MSDTPGSSGRRLVGDVAMQVVARVGNLALGVVVTALIVRMLGRAGYGQWSTVVAIVQLASYFTSFGLQGVVVRQAAAEPWREPELIGALLVLRFVLSLPALLVGLAIVVFAHESQGMLVAGVILLLQFPLGVGTALQVVHQLRVRNRWPMLVLSVNSVVWAAIVVVVRATGGGLVALAIGLTSCTLLSSLLQMAGALRIVRPSLRPPRDVVRMVLRIGAPVGLAGLLVLAYARIDQLIVFELAGSAQAGLYGAVYRVLDQSHFIPVSVMTSVAPMIAAAWPGNPDRMVVLVRRAAEFLAMGSLGALAFAVVAAEPVTRLLFGARFVPAAPALPVLVGAFVMICLSYLTNNLLLVFGLQRHLVSVGIGALVINVVGNLLLVPAYGFMAAAWMTLATEAFVVAGQAWIVRRGFAGRSLALGRLPRVAASAILLWVALAGLRAVGVPLAGLIVAAAVVYPVLLLGLRALRRDELRALLRRQSVPA